MDKNRQEIFLRDAKLDLDDIASKTPGLERMADAKLEEMGLISGRAVTPPLKPKPTPTVPSEPGAPAMPAFTADVELERAKPAGPDGIEGMTSQWELVFVKVKPSGVPPSGLLINPRIVEGDGDIFFTSDFRRETDGDGIAGFGFKFPRKPGLCKVRVGVEGASGGDKLELDFKALQVQPEIYLGADFGRPAGGGEDSGSGGIATINAPGVIGRTTLILEEVDSGGNAVASAGAKLRLFRRVYTSGEGGYARVPLLFINSSGVARLRAIFPEFGDADGNDIAVTKEVNFDAELAGIERTAAIVSGNGQIGYPGKELGEDFGEPIVVQFTAPSPPPDSGLTNKYLAFGVTGGKVRLPNGALAEGSFNVTVGSSNTVSLNFIMDSASDPAALSVYGFWSTPEGAMPIDAPPADLAVIRRPDVLLLSNANSEEILNVPVAHADNVDDDRLFRIRVRLPEEFAGSDPTVEVHARGIIGDAIPADVLYPSLSQVIPLAKVAEDLFESIHPIAATGPWDRRTVPLVATDHTLIVTGQTLLTKLQLPLGSYVDVLYQDVKEPALQGDYYAKPKRDFVTKDGYGFAFLWKKVNAGGYHIVQMLDIHAQWFDAKDKVVAEKVIQFTELWDARNEVRDPHVAMALDPSGYDKAVRVRETVTGRLVMASPRQTVGGSMQTMGEKGAIAKSVKIANDEIPDATFEATPFDSTLTQSWKPIILNQGGKMDYTGTLHGFNSEGKWVLLATAPPEKGTIILDGSLKSTVGEVLKWQRVFEAKKGEVGTLRVRRLDSKSSTIKEIDKDPLNADVK